MVSIGSSAAGSNVSVSLPSCWLDLHRAAAEQRGGLHLARQVGQFHLAVIRAEHVQEDGVALARAGHGLGRFPRAAAGAVDALAVLRQPGAHFLQALDLARFDDAVRASGRR